MATEKRRIGKAQAREQFAPLVESLVAGGTPVEITDYGKVVAILLSENEYNWLLQSANQNFRPKRPLRGSIKLIGSLEEASKDLLKDFESSLEKSVQEL
jgi:antitoxin (DNA-binding transcriptional repressor) of toxin-antitoxin stability system